MKILRRIIFIFLFIIFIPLLIYNITFIVKTNMNPDEVPDVFGYKMFIVLSGSMIPTLNIDDLVIAKEVGEEELKVGDMISFKDNYSIVTHRIVEIDSSTGENIYRTKGDNNNTIDSGDKKYSDIEGEVLFVIPKVGKVITFMQSKKAFILFMIVIFVTILYEYRKEDS